MKDMFGNMGSHKETAAAEEEEEPKGFMSGNVKVFSTSTEDKGEGPPRSSGQHTNAVEVESIEAEIASNTKDSGTTTTHWQGEEEGQPSQQSSSSSEDMFSNAWEGGPEPAPTSDNNNAFKAESNVLLQKAHQLLSQNPDIRAVVTRVQSSPHVREAVQDCWGNPAESGRYLDNPVVGPVLREPKEAVCISVGAEYIRGRWWWS